MKPFDEEKAKAGHPLITRDGYPGRLLGLNQDDPENLLDVAVNYGPAGVIVSHYYKNGRYLSTKAHQNDLFMAPVKKWRWAIARGRELAITHRHYASAEDIHEDSGGDWRVVQRIDETMIEE